MAGPHARWITVIPMVGGMRMDLRVPWLTASICIILSAGPLLAQPFHQDRYMAGHFYPLGADRKAPLASWEMTLGDDAWAHPADPRPS